MQPDDGLTYPARLQGLSLVLARGAAYRPGPWHVMVVTRACPSMLRAKLK